MYCKRCKQDKTAHLFPPSALNGSANQWCSKCWSEARGYDYGNMATRKLNTRMWQRSQDRKEFLSDNARKYFNQAEIKRLLEKRKRRLSA